MRNNVSVVYLDAIWMIKDFNEKQEFFPYKLQLKSNT